MQDFFSVGDIFLPGKFCLHRQKVPISGKFFLFWAWWGPLIKSQMLDLWGGIAVHRQKNQKLYRKNKNITKKRVCGTAFAVFNE